MPVVTRQEAAPLLVKELSSCRKALKDDPRLTIIGRHVYLPDYFDYWAQELEGAVSQAIQQEDGLQVFVVIVKSVSPDHIHVMLTRHLRLERRVTF